MKIITGIKHIRHSIEKRGLLILRISVAVIFIWFGFLKFFEGNAAEALASDTISWLTFGYVDEKTSVVALGAFECVIGLSLLSKKMLNLIIPIMYLQMCGTALPLVVFPEKTWLMFGMPTLEGQYIIKNLVLIAAGIILGAAGRGSKLIVNPRIAEEAKHKEEKLESVTDRE